MDHTAHQMSASEGAHDRHAGHSVAMFRDRFWLSFLLTLPVIVWSRDPQEWFGYQAPAFPGSDLVPAVLGTVVFVYGGLVFLRGGRDDAQAAVSLDGVDDRPQVEHVAVHARILQQRSERTVFSGRRRRSDDHFDAKRRGALVKKAFSR